MMFYSASTSKKVIRYERPEPVSDVLSSNIWSSSQEEKNSWKLGLN